jgi:hypothetical protein
MIDEAVHLQNPASEVLAVPQNPFFQLIHDNLHDQTIYRIVPLTPTVPSGGIPCVRTRKYDTIKL